MANKTFNKKIKTKNEKTVMLNKEKQVIQTTKAKKMVDERV